MPFLGGFEITSFAWLDSHSLAVRFTSTYTDKLYQLYLGRELIGVTEAFSDRMVIGTMVPTLWPNHITILAVDTDQINNDYGSALPERPYNRAKITATTVGWTDAKHIDVRAGTAPSGAVSASNLIETIPFDTNRTYSIVVPGTDTFRGSGTWNLEVAGRDDKPADGNLGTPQALSVDVLSHPPDVQIRSDNTRLSVDVSSGTATISFTEASE